MANTITQRISLVGGKELTEALKQLGEQGEKAFDRIQHAAAQVKGPGKDFSSGLAAISAGLKQAGASVANFGQSTRQIGQTVSIASAAVAAAGVAFVALGVKGAEAADAMGKNAEKAGTTIEAFGRLSFAAAQADIDTESFTTSIGRLSKNLALAASGNQAASELFRKLGVDIDAGGGKIKPVEQILQDLAGAFAKLPDGAEKSALAIEAFGRSGINLIPFLNQGKDGIIALGKEAEHLGVIFSPEEFKIGEEFDDQNKKLLAATSALADHIGLVFVPALTEASKAITDFVANNKGAIVGFVKDFNDAFEALPTGVKEFIGALVGLVIVIGPALVALGLFIQVIGFAISGLALLATPIGLTVLALIALGAAVGALVFEVAKHWDQIVSIFRDATQKWLTLLSNWLGRISSLAEEIAAPFKAVFNVVVDTIDGIVVEVIGFLDEIITKSERAVEAINSVQKAKQASGTGNGGEGGGGFAGGGMVNGPGSGTSDSIPAWLSDGEWIIRAAAVKKYGKGLFAALNNMRVNPNAFAGFADGGIVRAPVNNHFALGGPVLAAATSDSAGKRIFVDLKIGPEVFAGLLAPADVAERLARYSVAKKIQSGGRKPGWAQ